MDEEGLSHIKRLTNLEELTGREWFKATDVKLNFLNKIPNLKTENIISHVRSLDPH